MSRNSRVPFFTRLIQATRRAQSWTSLRLLIMALLALLFSGDTSRVEQHAAPSATAVSPAHVPLNRNGRV